MELSKEEEKIIQQRRQEKEAKAQKRKLENLAFKILGMLFLYKDCDCTDYVPFSDFVNYVQEIDLEEEELDIICEERNWQLFYDIFKTIKVEVNNRFK